MGEASFQRFFLGALYFASCFRVSFYAEVLGVVLGLASWFVFWFCLVESIFG